MSEMNQLQHSTFKTYFTIKDCKYITNWAYKLKEIKSFTIILPFCTFQKYMEKQQQLHNAKNKKVNT